MVSVNIQQNGFFNGHFFKVREGSLQNTDHERHGCSAIVHKNHWKDGNVNMVPDKGESKAVESGDTRGESGEGLGENDDPPFHQNACKHFQNGRKRQLLQNSFVLERVVRELVNSRSGQ